MIRCDNCNIISKIKDNNKYNDMYIKCKYCGNLIYIGSYDENN